MWIFNFSLILTFYPAVNPGMGVKGLSKHKNNTTFRLSIKFALKWYATIFIKIHLFFTLYLYKVSLSLWLSYFLTLYFIHYFYMTWFFMFFAFLRHDKSCCICFGPCTKNRVLLYFIHKVRFHKDKANIPSLNF